MKTLHGYGAGALCVLIGFFISCATVPRDEVYSSSTREDNKGRLEDIERAIVDQYRAPTMARNAVIKKELDSLLSAPSSDSNYLAHIYALYADWHILNKDTAAAKKMLKSAQNRNGGDEYVMLVQSRLTAKPEEKRSYLEEAAEHNPSFYRLKTELAAEYFLAGDYTKALAAFDAALDFLPQEYTELYAEKREYAAKYYEIDTDLGKDSARLLAQDTIRLIDMTSLTQDNTRVLDFITGTEHRSAKLLAEQLKSAGWYAPEVNVHTENATRKDAALFLWHIIAGDDFALLKRYSTKYIQRGKKSPLEDVELEGVYFDSILGVIEEDIIPLIDGKRFNPDGAVSGFDFYSWLKKTAAIRR